MTDGRIPGKWVSEPRFAEMPDAIFGFLARAIAWSNEAGTDGHIKNRYLAQLHASGEQRPHTYAYLVQAGLWRRVEDGYQFIDWNKKAHHGGLGQELAENVRSYKERKKANQRKYRERMANSPAVAGHVTGHVTGGMTDHVGQDRSTSSGSGSGSRDIQGGSLKTSGVSFGGGVDSGTDRQGTGDGDGDGDGDIPPAVGTPRLARVASFDSGYCSHGVTFSHRCRQCPSGFAQAEVA